VCFASPSSVLSSDNVSCKPIYVALRTPLGSPEALNFKGKDHKGLLDGGKPLLKDMGRDL
jgi:hypothetical protein